MHQLLVCVKEISHNLIDQEKISMASMLSNKRHDNISILNILKWFNCHMMFLMCKWCLKPCDNYIIWWCKMHRPNTTVESRPNVYIAEHLGLPKSFGNNSPFRPLEHGNTIRHFHKPQMKVIKVWQVKMTTLQLH
jgi:hypothetical protein